jgi:putative hemolysin
MSELNSEQGVESESKFKSELEFESEIKRFSLVRPQDSEIVRVVKQKYEVLMGLPHLYQQIESHQDLFQEQDPWSGFLKLKRIDLEIRGLHHIEKLSPNENLMIISNHPRGLLDGICLGSLATKYLSRPDFKFIASSVIGQVLPEFRSKLIAVEKISMLNKNQKYLNGLALSEALRVLQGQGTLIFHPAGLVSEFQFHSPEGVGKVTDLAWDQQLFRLALKTGCPILPVHISGQNSPSFQWASFGGDILKKSLLFREFMKAEDETVVLTIREPVTLVNGRDSVLDQVSRLRYSLYKESKKTTLR